MLPTSAMMRTTVKTKNIGACSSGSPGDQDGSWIVRQRECNTRFRANLSGRRGGLAALSGGTRLWLKRLHAVDLGDEAARFSVAHVDVLDVGLIENSGDCRLGRSAIYFFSRGHPSIAPVTFEHERQ